MLEMCEVSRKELSSWREMLAHRRSVLRLEPMYGDPAVAAEKADEMVGRMLDSSRGFVVEEAGRPAGHLWWGPDSEDSAVLDARLDDPGRVAELLPALQRLAREDAARRIGVGGIPADQTLTALAALPGFVTRGTNMELWLEQAVGDPGPVELRPMTQKEFDVFFQAMLTGYTAELVAAGISEERATEHARTQSAELVPDGLASPHARFFTGWVEDQSVGRLWIGTERPMAFVYELEVREDQRRKGYGEAIMNAGARWCQDRGIFALGLNVFGHNPGARRLYDKLGYEVTLDYRTLDVDDVADAG